MSASKLIRPDARFQTSFLVSLREYHAEGRFTYLKPERLALDFEGFIKELRAEKGYPHQPYQDWVEPVPETILWLVKDDTYIGTVDIRHRLNWHLEKWGGHLHFVIRPTQRGKGFGKKILLKAIPFAHHLGSDKALLTIEPDNDAAIRIVEFCGGVFDDETQATECFPARKRYWLECA